MIKTYRRSSALLGIAVAAIALAISSLTTAPASSGTFPGKNGLIAFMGKTQDPNDGFNLYTYDLATSTTNPLTFGPDDHLYPQWSGDGKKISYTKIDSITSDLSATIMNYDGTGVREIATPPNENYLFPVISPNGQQLAMIAENQTTNERTLIITDMKGGNPRTVPTPNRLPDSPQWSPDGSSIVFTGDSNQGNQTRQLWVVNVDGTGLRQVTDGPDSANIPNWSPDGSQIAYTRQGQNDLSYVINVDGTNDRPLNTDPAYANTAVPSFSPDGTQLAYSAEQANGGLVLALQDIDGSNRRVLTPTVNGAGFNSAAYPAWQPIPQTELTVQGLKKGKKLKAGDKYKLVKSADTNGQITKVKVVCKTQGKKVTGKKSQKAVCGAKEKKKKDPTTTRIVTKPKCDSKVRIKAVVTAEYPNADPLKWKRTWKVKNNTGPACAS